MNTPKASMAQISPNIFGVFTDSARFVKGRLEVYTSPMAAQKVVESIRRLLICGRVHSAETAKLRGVTPGQTQTSWGAQQERA